MARNIPAKTIVIMCDGAAGGDESFSTIRRLAGMALDDGTRQICFQDEGAGRRPFSGRVVGFGLSKRVRECCHFLAETWRPGDRIFLFGYGQGAFAIRCLAGLLQVCGLVRREAEIDHLVDLAHDHYRIPDPVTRAALCARFKERYGQEVAIDFLGVWDTVAAPGLPFAWMDALSPRHPRFHDNRLPAGVRRACQALALDEPRRHLRPEIWAEHGLWPGQSVEQVWFAGAHRDIGGGRPDRGLADIALGWMLDRATAGPGPGLLLRPDHGVVLAPDPLAPPEAANGSRPGGVRAPLLRPLRTPLRLHRSVATRRDRIGGRSWILDWPVEFVD